MTNVEKLKELGIAAVEANNNAFFADLEYIGKPDVEELKLHSEEMAQKLIVANENYSNFLTRIKQGLVLNDKCASADMNINAA